MTWTAERHRAAKERCEQATEAPWNCELNSHREYDVFRLGEVASMTIELGQLREFDDALFTIRARTDLPDALAEIERLQAELGRARSYIAEVNHAIGGAEQLEDIQHWYRLPSQINDLLEARS